MSKGDPDQNNGEKLLEEFELGEELTTIANQRLLPPRVVQRIREKLKEKNVKITKNQLYKLVEKIQTILISAVRINEETRK
jgi:hypothetical protein